MFYYVLHETRMRMRAGPLAVAMQRWAVVSSMTLKAYTNERIPTRPRVQFTVAIPDVNDNRHPHFLLLIWGQSTIKRRLESRLGTTCEEHDSLLASGWDCNDEGLCE